MTRTATLAFKKETKGALMFEEIDAHGQPTVDVLGSLYLRKSALAGARPAQISVTITTEAQQ